MNKIKTLTRYVLYSLICLYFTNCNCKSECKRREREESKKLILETEHCRYYCMERDGFGKCKVITCDCDEGYSCDVNISW